MVSKIEQEARAVTGSARVSASMSASDALLWTMGRDPALRSTITAVALFDRSPQWEHLVARVEDLVASVPQLRSTVAPAPASVASLQWVEDPSFELGHHLRRIRAPRPATLRTVLDLAQQMAIPAFDPAIPPWEVTLVGGLEGGGAALVVKVHHAVVDGVGGISLVELLLDEQRPGRRRAPTPSPGRDPSAMHIAHVPATLASTFGRSLQVASAAFRAAIHPDESLRVAAAAALSAARLLMPASKPLSPLLRGRGIHRRFEVLDFSYEQLSQAAAASGGTVNDLFVAAVLDGLRRYHDGHGSPVARLRMTMPVSIRHDTDPVTGNRFVPVRFVLPTVAGDAAVRVRGVHEIAGEWKHAPGLELTSRLGGALSLLPRALATAAFAAMLKGTDFVATNVAGPRTESFLAGARLDRLYAFAPTSGAALNVALVSVVERACVGIAIDTASISDSEVLLGCLEAAFDELLQVQQVAAGSGTEGEAGGAGTGGKEEGDGRR